MPRLNTRPDCDSVRKVDRRLGRDAEGENVLRAAVSASPQDAGLHYALGLTLTRLKQPDPALMEFRRATELEPDRARYAYVYAVALYSAGHVSDAMTVLKHSLTQHPVDRDTLQALVGFSQASGDISCALEYDARLAWISPDDQGLAHLVEELRRQAVKSNAN